VAAPAQLSAREHLMAALPRSVTTTSHSLLPQGMTLDSASGVRRQRAVQSAPGGGVAAAIATGSPMPKLSRHATAQAVLAKARRTTLSEAGKKLFWELEPMYCKAARPDWQAMAADFNSKVALRLGAATDVPLDPEQQLTYKSAADLQTYHVGLSPGPDPEQAAVPAPEPTVAEAREARRRRMLLIRTGGAGSAAARPRRQREQLRARRACAMGLRLRLRPTLAARAPPTRAGAVTGPSRTPGRTA
jgi:hypothetical protein